jgi:hypothetical protein
LDEASHKKKSITNPLIIHMAGENGRSWTSRWAVSILVLLIPFSVFWPVGRPIAAMILSMYGTPGLYLTDLVVIPVLLLALLGISLKQNREKIVFHKKILLLGIPIFILVILALLTSPMAISPALARYTALRWLLAVSLYLALVFLDIPVKQMVEIFMIGLAIQALVGLGQVIYQGPLNMPGELALNINQSRAAVINIEGIPWLRAYGLTFHPNVLGGILCCGLLLGLPLLERKLMRVVWWLIGLGLFLSFSRSAWLGVVVTLPATIVWVYWRSPKLRRPLLWTLIPFSLVAIFGIALLKNQIFTHLNPLQTFSEFTSISERGQLITIALADIREHLFTGIGAGNFPLSMLDYKTLDPPHYVHNVSLLLAAEVGIFGGLIWYWLWLIPTFTIERFWLSNKIWPVVLIAAWFAWGLIALWDSYPWALESGRLFTIMLLAWISKECIS